MAKGNNNKSTKTNQYNPDDLDYMRSTSAAMLEQTPKRSRLLLYSIILFFIVMTTWAVNAELDEVTRGDGKVIPSQKVQVIQNLEGGIIADILVKEGQIVDKGQIVLKINDTGFKSSFMESRLRYLELLAQSARLEAEADGKKTFTVPKEVLKEKPELARNEQSLFASHRRGQRNSISIIKHQTSKFQHELSEAKSKAKQVKRNLKLAKKELNIIKPLYKSGAVSQVKLIQVERLVNDLDSELDAINNSLPRLRVSIQESRQKEKEVSSTFRNTAREELNIALAEIPRIKESIGSLKDKVSRREVRSPVKGTVKQLLVNTIDGVVQPGMDLIEIVPLDDALVVEAKIRPKDISYLFPGQKAKVKVTAYDPSQYGSLDAEVIHISADTIVDTEKGKEESYYLVRVKTTQNFLLNKANEKLHIIPGMITETDILSGKRTVFNYLFKPILRAQSTALREH